MIQQGDQGEVGLGGRWRLLFPVGGKASRGDLGIDMFAVSCPGLESRRKRERKVVIEVLSLPRTMQ